MVCLPSVFPSAEPHFTWEGRRSQEREPIDFALLAVFRRGPGEEVHETFQTLEDLG